MVTNQQRQTFTHVQQKRRNVVLYTSTWCCSSWSVVGLQQASVSSVSSGSNVSNIVARWSELPTSTSIIRQTLSVKTKLGTVKNFFCVKKRLEAFVCMCLLEACECTLILYVNQIKVPEESLYTKTCMFVLQFQTMNGLAVIICAD